MYYQLLLVQAVSAIFVWFVWDGILVCLPWVDITNNKSSDKILVGDSDVNVLS